MTGNAAQQHVYEFGGAVFGITHAEPLSAPANAPFVSPDATLRTNPKAHLAQAQSVIAAALPPARLKYPPMPEGAARLSSLVIMQDYHLRVRRVLRQLQDLLHIKKGDACVFVDSPHLDERALALRAGLGFVGKNGMLITPEFGSWCNIGVLISKLPVLEVVARLVGLGASERPAAAETGCPDGCGLCLQACKIPQDKRNPFLCRSYLTQKSELTNEEACQITSDVFGCDDCQNACPKNKPVQGIQVCPVWLSGLSADEIKCIFKDAGCLWRGADIILRNAALVLRNNTYAKYGQSAK